MWAWAVLAGFEVCLGWPKLFEIKKFALAAAVSDSDARPGDDELVLIENWPKQVAEREVNLLRPLSVM